MVFTLPLHNNAKTITSLDTIDPALIAGLENPGEAEHQYNIDGFSRKMGFRVTMLRDNNRGDLGYLTKKESEFIKTLETLDYYSILMGEIPGWEPVRADVVNSGVILYYWKFSGEGALENWVKLRISYPQSAMNFEIALDKRSDPEKDCPDERFRYYTYSLDKGKTFIIGATRYLQGIAMQDLTYHDIDGEFCETISKRQ